MSGQPLAIHLNWHTAIPGLHESHMWVALTGVIMSYCGMEIATVHGQDVNDPQRAYPRAMLYATLILLVTLIGGSLAIAIVLPNDHISLVAGIMQAFSAFFTAYHMAWILPLIAVMLVIGGMGGVSNWIIAPTRGLELAARDGSLPRHCRLENRYGAPVALLLYQAVIASLMTGAFLWMPSVNASYWLLTVLAAQQYMLMYMIMFVTAILWRYRDFSKLPGYRIGGGRYGMCFVAGTGFVGSLLTFFIGFIPPHDMNTGGFWHYEGSLLLGLVVMLVLPLLLRRYTQAAEAKRTL
jgi:amino acid transporter